MKKLVIILVAILFASCASQRSEITHWLMDSKNIDGKKTSLYSAGYSPENSFNGQKMTLCKELENDGSQSKYFDIVDFHPSVDKKEGFHITLLATMEAKDASSYYGLVVSGYSGDDTKLLFNGEDVKCIVNEKESLSDSPSSTSDNVDVKMDIVKINNSIWFLIEDKKVHRLKEKDFEWNKISVEVPGKCKVKVFSIESEHFEYPSVNYTSTY